MANDGVVEKVTGAIAQAVIKLSSRKVGIALVGMWLIANATEPESREFVFWLCVAALASQMLQDVVKIIVTGKDHSDNGNGDDVVVESLPELREEG